MDSPSGFLPHIYRGLYSLVWLVLGLGGTQFLIPLQLWGQKACFLESMKKLLCSYGGQSTSFSVRVVLKSVKYACPIGFLDILVYAYDVTGRTVSGGVKCCWNKSVALCLVILKGVLVEDIQYVQWVHGQKHSPDMAEGLLPCLLNLDMVLCPNTSSSLWGGCCWSSSIHRALATSVTIALSQVQSE